MKPLVILAIMYNVFLSSFLVAIISRRHYCERVNPGAQSMHHAEIDTRVGWRAVDCLATPAHPRVALDTTSSL